MVRPKGLEPSRLLQRQDLNLVRLPIPPRPRKTDHFSSPGGSGGASGATAAGSPPVGRTPPAGPPFYNPRMTESAPATASWLSSTSHYENFPVGSVLVPATLRPDLAAVYRFARYADDVADEGEATSDARVAELGRLSLALCEGPAHPVVEPLLPVMRRHRMDRSLFLALLQAFRWDAEGRSFPERAALHEYCRHSADPVGRLVLRLFDADHQADLAASDAVCTALQLINFVQDLGQDHARARCYLPADEMHRFGVTAQMLDRDVAARRTGPRLRLLLDHQLAVAAPLLAAGRRLIRSHLPLRLRLELRAILAGGQSMLERLRSEDPLAARIKLGRADAIRLLRNAVSLPGAHA